MNPLKTREGVATVLGGRRATPLPRAMRKAQGTFFVKFTKCFALSLIISLLPFFTKAQEPSSNSPNFPINMDCFGHLEEPDSGVNNIGASPESFLSSNGLYHTPKGDLKVLVIFAGIEEDNPIPAPGTVSPVYRNNSDPKNDWPQTDATHSVWGTALPRDLTTKFGYTSNSSFSSTATDLTISNFFYQMSKGQFRLTFGYFPDRINVPYNPAANNMFAYSDSVMSKIARDYPNFDFSPYDQRTNMTGFGFNGTSFSTDNSNSSPDGKIDYTVIIWRLNGDSPYGMGDTIRAGGAWAGVSYKEFQATPPNTVNYQTHAGHTEAKGNIDKNLFLHEFAHNLYNSPHYLGANTVHGTHFYNNYGWGMMNGVRTNFTANGWERWYNGWIDISTGSTQINSDIQSANDLTVDGLYTLRDFVETGDVVRIKIPHTDQFLWLENHTGNSIFDERDGWILSGRSTPDTLQPTPKGILAYVENLAPSRADPVSPTDTTYGNGIKVISADGNYDYSPTSYQPDKYNNYLYDNYLYNLNPPIANPFGGQNEICNIKIDKDQNGIINYTKDHGNNDAGIGHEITYVVVVENDFVDGLFGPNIGFNTVGKKMGLSYNPAIFPHQNYSRTNTKLTPISIHGLSVEVTNIAANGDITVKIRFDDNNVVENIRWTGDLIQPTNMTINVNAGKTLTINKSGTPNRHTQLNGEFVNPTTYTMESGSVLNIANGAHVVIEDGTVFKIKSGAKVNLGINSSFTVRGNSRLEIEDNAEFIARQYSNLNIEDDSKLILNNTVQNKGLYAYNLSSINIGCNSQMIIEPLAHFQYRNLTSSTGLNLNCNYAELLVKGELRTDSNVNLTFRGNGFITFDGDQAALHLGTNSSIIQQGSGVTDFIYRFVNESSIEAYPYLVNLSNGLITYEQNTSLTIDGNTQAGLTVAENIFFNGAPSNSTASFGLYCKNFTSVNLTDCVFNKFQGSGLLIENTSSTYLLRTEISDIVGKAIDFLEGNDELILDNSIITSSGTGINSISSGHIYLNNQTEIFKNGTGIISYPGIGNSITLHFGIEGCAWLVDNENGGIIGENTILDIDAIQHQDAIGGCYPQINRFDGNTGNGSKIFEICHEGGLASNTLNANGNYWGFGGLDGSDYEISSECRYNPTTEKLYADNYISCQPVNCISCDGSIPVCPPPGGGDSRMAVSNQPSESTQNFKVDVYPNPSSSNINLITEGATSGFMTYELYNSKGAKVMNGSFKGKNSILNVERLPSDIYMLILTNDHQQRNTSKIVVSK